MSEPKSRSTRLRRLTDEEIELWLTVATTVARRPGAILPHAALMTAAPTGPAPAPRLAPPPPVPPRAALKPLAPLERKLKQKLSRGRVTADAAIDLHGLRRDEAHAALQRFLSSAQRRSLKVVLVVTGKGSSNKKAHGRGTGDLDLDDWAFGETIGVLRRQVPLWLALPEFRALVLGWEEAGRPHGGAGALYVRLRRGTHRSAEFD